MSGSRSTTSEVTLDPDDPLGNGAETLAPDRSLAVFEIGRRFLASRRPGEVQERIQSALLEHLQPDHAAILRREPSGELTPVWSHGLDLEGPSSDDTGPHDWAVTPAAGGSRPGGPICMGTGERRRS